MHMLLVNVTVNTETILALPERRILHWSLCCPLQRIHMLGAQAFALGNLSFGSPLRHNIAIDMQNFLGAVEVVAEAGACTRYVLLAGTARKNHRSSPCMFLMIPSHFDNSSRVVIIGIL
nr:hypothetical protein CFP56_00227 [Quercus suber]